MKNRKVIFAVIVVCAILPVYGESLLQATSFPKTVNDLDFVDKWEIMAEAYGEFDRLYDENGNCVSGCPYGGITIQQDKEDVEEATELFANMMELADTPAGNQNISGNNPVNNEPLPTPNSSYVGGNSVNSLLPLGSPINRDSIIITSDFYFRKSPYGFHNGVDIGVVSGTNVYATGGGTIDAIDRSGRTSSGELTYNGPYVKIKHGNTGFYSWYLHLSHIPSELYKGMPVSRGTYIGKSGGATGDCKRCSGAHLHYSISTRKSGRDVYVDVLCPWRGTKMSQEVRHNKEVSTRVENNDNMLEYNSLAQPKHSSFNQYNYYSFASKQTRKNSEPWRIEAKHCMVHPSDKLPDEK